MIKETFFALVIVFNQSPEQWQEVSYSETLTFEQCDIAQRAIWSQNWQTIGHDESGALSEVDAYCIELSRLESPEFSNVFR